MIAARFGALGRFSLVGSTGFVSDDTEQAALLAQALAGRGDQDVERRFRRSLLGWFARLPFGIGLSTLRACLLLALGVRRSGVRSAGNGAAMRAAILGAVLAHDAARRRRLGERLARVTHTDARAVEGALFVAEVAAGCSTEPPAARQTLVDASRTVITHPELLAAVDRAVALAGGGVADHAAAAALRTSGFVVHTVGLATYCLLRHGADPMEAIRAAIRAGGDTDSNAAIVGAWVGGLHGEEALPGSLLSHLHDGPFGPTHLRALARALAAGDPPPRWSWVAALLRNLSLYPVVFAHGVRRLVPCAHRRYVSAHRAGTCSPAIQMCDLGLTERRQERRGRR